MFAHGRVATESEASIERRHGGFVLPPPRAYKAAAFPQPGSSWRYRQPTRERLFGGLELTQREEGEAL